MVVLMIFLRPVTSWGEILILSLVENMESRSCCCRLRICLNLLGVISIKATKNHDYSVSSLPVSRVLVEANF